MTVMEYCCTVRRLLLEVDVDEEDRVMWLQDLVGLTVAMSYVDEGHEVPAQQLAEEIAERWRFLV